MSFFSKGSFKIEESWEKKPPSRVSNSREKDREKLKESSLVNAGKNIINEPNPDILDDELSKRILKDFASEMTPFPSSKQDKKSNKEEPSKMPPKSKMPNPSHAHNEADLLTSMAARLKTVEQTCKNQREQIKEKSEALEKMKAENSFLKSYRDNATEEYEKLKQMEAENGELRRKVEEMEGYLRKYGLKWVGSKMEGSLEHQKIKQDIKKPNYQYRLPSEIDINTILRRAEELNAGLHSEGMGTEVYQQNGVHKFRKAEGLPMGFFSNGIAIKGYKFFPYQSKESLQILGDLVDGYFPYVLKAKYPNGVFLKVVDKIAEKYLNQSSDETINTFETNLDNDFKPPSKEEFLNKLPKQVVKNGKVFNIRSEIEKRLNGQPEKAIKQEQQEENDVVAEEARGLVIKTEEFWRIQAKQASEEEVCQLKVRSEAGKVYILLLEKQRSMRDVYLHMKKVVKAGFKVMGNFPRRTYEATESQDLESLGFYPNAMLYLQSAGE